MNERLYRGIKEDSVWGMSLNEWQMSYDGLASAIILQALKDYVGRNYNRSNMGEKDFNKADAEQFLRSKYYDFLCVTIDVPGQKILDHVDEHGLSQIHISNIIDGWVEDERNRRFRRRKKKTACNC